MPQFLSNRRAVDTYFTRMSEEQLLEQPGLQPLRKKLLQSALDYYESFLAQRGDDRQHCAPQPGHDSTVMPDEAWEVEPYALVAVSTTFSPSPAMSATPAVAQ